MNFHIFVLTASGVLANWLIACTLLVVFDRVKAGEASGSWLKFGLRKTYCHLVDEFIAEIINPGSMYYLDIEI